MDKTLYILEKRGLEVLRDGPSIWIMENGKAGRRVPARLVSHVVIIGNVKMDAGTITLFTDNNVPVTFMSKNRGEFAVTIPHNHHLNSHSEEQKHLLARDGNIQRYNQWLQAERRRMQLKVVKKLSRQVSSVFISKGFGEQEYKDFITRCASVGKKRWRIINETVKNMLNEMVMKSILASDLDPHIGIFHRRDNFGFALDIMYAMEPEADLQTIQFFKSDKNMELLVMTSTGLKLTGDGMRDVVLRFENKKKLINGLIDVVIDDFFAIMRTIRSFVYDDKINPRRFLKP